MVSAIMVPGMQNSVRESWTLKGTWFKLGERQVSYGKEAAEARHVKTKESVGH